MTPARFRRRSSDVEAIHLTTHRDLTRAEAWLHHRGVGAATTHPALHGRGLQIPSRRGAGSFEIARIGEWVVIDLSTGRADWATVEEFGLLHDELAVTEADGIGA